MPSPKVPLACLLLALAVLVGCGGGEEKDSTTSSIQRYGSEASASELEDAAQALHLYLEARAAHRWTAACANLSAATIRGLRQFVTSSGNKGPTSCPRILAALFSRAPLDPAAEPRALRVEGGRAFLLYLGPEATEYFIPMTLEDGAWKVAALAPTPL